MLFKYNVKSVFVLFLLFKVVALNLHPVVLIPGDGGNQLEARLNKTGAVHYICQKVTTGYFNIWLNLELLLPLVIDCWIDNIRLIYDNKTRTTRSPDGIEIQVPGWGLSEPVEWIDPSHDSTGAYFKDIANTLVKMGYIRNQNIRGAPYDFRKAPNENQEYFVKLRQLIEDTYNENNNTSVMLIAHSMGGPMSLHFLNMQDQSWKDKYIRNLVTLSGVWGGSMKAVKVYAIGDDLGSYALRESVMRQEQITSPSLAWLLPSKLFWKPDEVLVQTEKTNFTIEDLEDFFRGISFEEGWEMRKDTEPLQLTFKPPGVEVHCLYGSNVSTVEKLYYKPGTWLDGYPTLIYGDGDSTVNLRSLQGCEHWQQLQKQKVFVKPLPNVDHLQILHDQKVQQYVADLVKTDNPNYRDYIVPKNNEKWYHKILNTFRGSSKESSPIEVSDKDNIEYSWGDFRLNDV